MAAATRKPFPDTPEAFDADDRIAWSREQKTFLLEDEQGKEWEWHASVGKWVETTDSDLIAQQAEIYKMQDVDEHAPANPRKRKEGRLEDPATNPQTTARKTATAAPPRNSAVWVTGLPSDADADEINRTFSRYGIIAESMDTNEPRIKLYYNDAGVFKGDALIVYYRPESVQTAVYMADGTDFRQGGNGDMRVRLADESYKVHKADAATPGNAAPAQNKGKRPPVGRDQKKAAKKAEEMKSRLADWGDDDVSALPDASSPWDKVVVVKHVFTPAELDQDPDLIDEVLADMQEGGSAFGDVVEVIIYDDEPDGAVTIRFRDDAAANDCVRKFHGRHYNYHILQAHIATGKERLKRKPKKGKNKGEYDYEDEARRLEEYSKFIEQDDPPEGNASSAAAPNAR